VISQTCVVPQISSRSVAQNALPILDILQQKIIYQLVDSNPSTSTPGFACAQQRRKRHFHGIPASISIPVNHVDVASSQWLRN